MKESDIEKTAFSTSKGGLYEYLVMPMGMCESENSFQCCVELVFRGLNWRTLLVYMDDLICFGRLFEETLERLEEVFQRLVNANLKLKPKNYCLFQNDVSLFGYRVTAEGIMPEISRVEYIQVIPVPRNLTELRHFLEYLGYYRRFIKGFSERATPLNRLMEAGQLFIWIDECQEAFLDLRSALFGDEVMAFRRFDEKGGAFIVDCDSSNYATGGCLSQMQWCDQTQSEVERPIMSASDNSSLRWLMRFKSPTDQLARWLEVLSEYDFALIHRKESKHVNTDFWSHVGYDPYTCHCYDKSTILEELPCGGCKTCRKRHKQWTVLKDVDDVIPLFARSVSYQNSPHNRNGNSFCIRMLLTLITLFCVVARTIPEQGKGAVAVLGRYLNLGISNAFNAIKAVWSRPVRRLRPSPSKDSLAESPVFRFGYERNSKFHGVKSQSDKSSSSGTILVTD